MAWLAELDPGRTQPKRRLGFRLYGDVMRFGNLKLYASIGFFICCLLRVGYRATNRDSVTQSDEPGPNAVILADQPVFDFGTMQKGKAFTHVFSLQNVSDHEVTISKVRAECGCSTTELSQKVIQPSGSVPLTVSVSLRHLRGNVEKRVVLTIDHPDQPVLVVKTKGFVKTDYTVEPLKLDFGEVLADQPLKGTVEISSTKSRPFKILKINCDSHLCQVSSETLENGKRHRLTVCVIGERSASFWKAPIWIETDNPDEPGVGFSAVARLRSTDD